jgi:hypothetical protein
VTLGGQSVAATAKVTDGQIAIQFASPVTIPTGGKLQIEIA